MCPVVDDCVAEWLLSEQGQEYIDNVYEDGFDEGWENAISVLGGLTTEDLIDTFRSSDNNDRLR